jgi:hypothetical protein
MDFWVISGGLSKFDSARLFFSEFPEFMKYEAFAFFDPDVGIDFDEINSLFITGVKERKALFQAAVAHGSHTVWSFLYKKNTTGWREVSFVEVMAPFFSKEALFSVVDDFSDSISTWGLEYQWYSKCKNMSMAVYDPIVMRHDTKVDTIGGPFYKYLAQINIDPSFELKKIRSASVGRFFIECEIPSWMPLWVKKYYIPVIGMTVALRQRLASSRIGKVSEGLLTVITGKRSPKEY